MFSQQTRTIRIRNTKIIFIRFMSEVRNFTTVDLKNKVCTENSLEIYCTYSVARDILEYVQSPI